MNVRVLVVDDEPAARTGIARLVAATPGFDVAGEAGDGRSASVRQVSATGSYTSVVARFWASAPSWPGARPPVTYNLPSMTPETAWLRATVAAARGS